MNSIKHSKDFESPLNDSSSQEYLKETIRTLISNTKALETYKSLCELRIRELVPNHPLPISKDHIGKNISAPHKLQTVNQQTCKLEHQASIKSKSLSEFYGDSEIKAYLSEILKEKNQVEESLRAEMLNCEEQRVYIEALKQTLEENTDEKARGFGGMEPIKEVLVFKARNIEMKREIANLKMIVLDQKGKIEKYERFFKSKEEEVMKISKGKEKLACNLKQASDALQTAEEEVGKIEEEKQELLEYIEEHTQKEQEMENEMNDLVKLFEEMKRNYTVTMKKVNENTEMKEKLTEEIKSLESKHKRSELSNKELQDKISSLTEKINELESSLKAARYTNNSLEIKIESLRANITTLSETLKETQQESEFFQQNAIKLKALLKDKEEANLVLKSEKLSVSNKYSKVKQTIKLLEHERKSDREQHKAKVLQLKEEIANLNTILTEYEKKCKLCEEVEETHKEEKTKIEADVNNIKNEIEVLKQSNKSIESEKKILEEEVDKLYKVRGELTEIHNECVELKYREKMQVQVIEDLRSKNIQINQELDQMFQDLQKSQFECANKKQEADDEKNRALELIKELERIKDEKCLIQRLLDEEKNNFKSYVKANCAQKDSLERKSLEDFKPIKYHLESLICQSNLKESRMKSLESSLSRLKDEIKSTANLLEVKEIEVSNIKFQISECFSTLSRHFPIDSDSFSKYSSIFSINFKNCLQCLLSQRFYTVQGLLSYIESSADYIKFLCEKVFDFRDDLVDKNKELALVLSRVKPFHEEISAYKQELARLSQENLNVKSLMLDNQALLSQTTTLKSEIHLISEENHRLKSTLRRFQSDKNLRTNLSGSCSSVALKEPLNWPVRCESRDFDGLLSERSERPRLKINSSDNHREGSRAPNELEYLERKRLNIECQLLKLQSDPKTREASLLKELKLKLKNYQNQIKAKENPKFTT